MNELSAEQIQSAIDTEAVDLAHVIRHEIYGAGSTKFERQLATTVLSFYGRLQDARATICKCSENTADALRERDEARKRLDVLDGCNQQWAAKAGDLQTDMDEARRQLDIARKAPCAPDCASRKAVCADCYRPTGMLGACHGFGEVVNGKVLEGAQYSSHLFPHPCNCWKSQITPTETPNAAL